MKRVAMLLSATVILSAVTARAAEDDGFVDLLAPGDLSRFTTEGNWAVQEDGTVKLEPRPGESGWTRYGSYLWLDEQYADFVFQLDFKLPPRGNSGVYFHVGDKSDATDTGIEVQILDSHGKKKLSHHDCGGVIRTQAPSKNAVKPAGDWNHLTVTCRDNRVSVELNGEQIIDDVQLGDSPMKGRPKKGWIGLQDHGQPIWFRNLKIKRLD